MTWVLLGLAGAGILGPAVLGIVWALGRDFGARDAADLQEGFLGPFLRTAPWIALSLGAFLGIVDLLTGSGYLLLLVGAGAGIVVSALLIGWDEFFDRVSPTFYASVRREVHSFFSTPIPYFVLFLFVVLCGIFFWANLKFTRTVSMAPVFGQVTSLCFFLFPLLTMALFARERSEGTIEVLMTAPVSDTTVVLSKFLGTLVFYLAMLLPTVLYYFVLKHIGEEIGKPDPGPVISAYVGMILAGGFFISVGLFTSSITSSQILAALFAWVLIIFFLLSRGIVDLMGLAGTWLGDAIEYVDPLNAHLQPFLRGVIDVKDVLFFLSFTVFFLFLSVRSVESRKWR